MQDSYEYFFLRKKFLILVNKVEIDISHPPQTVDRLLVCCRYQGNQSTSDCRLTAIEQHDALMGPK